MESYEETGREELHSPSLGKIKTLDLAWRCKTSPSHVVPSMRMLGGGFIGGFVRGCSVKAQENQRLEADPELQVQNIE